MLSISSHRQCIRPARPSLPLPLPRPLSRALPLPRAQRFQNSREHMASSVKISSRPNSIKIDNPIFTVPG